MSIHRPPRLVPVRPIDDCPVCNSAVSTVRVTEGGACHAEQCGHRVSVTIWPDRVELQEWRP